MRGPHTHPHPPRCLTPAASLSAAAKKLGATIAFDAVCGEMTGRLVTAMPRHSTVHVYGALSQAPASGISSGASLVPLLPPRTPFLTALRAGAEQGTSSSRARRWRGSG